MFLLVIVCLVFMIVGGSIDVRGGAGAYVFFDDSGGVYYVGEADDVARRLLQEHCRADIGGSEGVVRFLMHYLDEICANSGEWAGLMPWVGRNSLRKF